MTVLMSPLPTSRMPLSAVLMCLYTLLACMGVFLLVYWIRPENLGVCA